MKSIISSIVGSPRQIPHGIVLPISIVVADDFDTDEETLPLPEESVMKIFLSSDALSNTREYVHDTIMERLAKERLGYGAKGWMQLIDNVKNFLTRHDIRSMHGPHIPFPNSSTRH